MKQAEKLREISKKNYHKAETVAIETMTDIYKQAKKAAEKGYQSIKYKLNDSLTFYMIIPKLKEEGFIVYDCGDHHTIIIDWGKVYEEPDLEKKQ